MFRIKAWDLLPYYIPLVPAKKNLLNKCSWARTPYWSLLHHQVRFWIPRWLLLSCIIKKSMFSAPAAAPSRDRHHSLRLCGVRTSLPRPAFHLAVPPQPHSPSAYRPFLRTAPQRRRRHTAAPIDGMLPWPGTRRPAAIGISARLCGVRTALTRPAFHLAAPPSPTASACRPCSRAAP